MQRVEQDAIGVPKNVSAIGNAGVLPPPPWVFLCDSLTHQAEFQHTALMEIQGSSRHFNLEILASA